LGPNHRRVRNGQASRLPISNRDRNLGQKILTDSKLSTSHFLIGQIPASSPSSPRRPSLIWGLTLDARQGILALSGHGFNRAVLPNPLASLPLARFSSSRRLRRACAKSSPRPRLLSPAFVRRCEQLAPFARFSSSRRPRRASAKSNPNNALEARFREPLPFVYPDAGRARHSRPSSLSKAQRNDGEGILALSGHGFNRAVLPNPLASLPLARLFGSRGRQPASAKSSPCPSLGPSQELLDAYLNGRKQSTSHFLIDNFCVPFALTPISKAQPGLTLLLRDRPARGSRFRPCSPLATRHCPS
jgi:hypothetical protein